MLLIACNFCSNFNGGPGQPKELGDLNVITVKMYKMSNFNVKPGQFWPEMHS